MVITHKEHGSPKSSKESVRGLPFTLSAPLISGERQLYERISLKHKWLAANIINRAITSLYTATTAENLLLNRKTNLRMTTRPTTEHWRGTRRLEKSFKNKQTIRLTGSSANSSRQQSGTNSSTKTPQAWSILDGRDGTLHGTSKSGAHDVCLRCLGAVYAYRTSYPSSRVETMAGISRTNMQSGTLTSRPRHIFTVLNQSQIMGVLHSSITVTVTGAGTEDH
jgi:hypothetical protein